MKLKIFYFVFLSVIIISCQNSNSNGNAELILSFDIEQADQVIQDKDAGIFDTDAVEMLQIQCPSGIYGVERVKFDGDKMVVLGSDQQKLHILNTDGECINEINHLGHGHNEYTSIGAFEAYDGKVYLFDWMEEKVLVYNYNGDCEQVIGHSDFWANDILALGDYLFLFNNDDSNKHFGNYHVYEVNKDFSFVSSYVPFDKPTSFACRDGFGCAKFSNDSAFYARRDARTIYKVAHGFCEPFVTIDFGDLNIPEEYLSYNYLQLVQNGLDDKFALGIEEIAASENYLFIMCDVKDETYCLVMNHKTKEVLHTYSFFKDNKFGLGYTISPIHDNIMFSFMTAESFVDYYECTFLGKDMTDNKSLKRMKEIYDNEVHTDSGNSLIIKYKLK